MIYILFDANKNGALEKLQTYHTFISQYIKNRKIKIKVIALRVPPQPSADMTKLLNEVRQWTDKVEYDFLKF